MVFKLTLEFDGTDFHGWQIQPEKRTVQGEMVKALSRITSGPFKLIGSSRTDAGVHALNFVASLHIEGKYLRVDSDRLKDALNGLLPEDIYVKEVQRASEDFHARYSARSKVYMYRVITYPSPLRRRYAYHFPIKESLRSLNEKAKIFLGRHDFTHISAKSDREGICHIIASKWEKKGDEYIYTVEGDRFLYKMVRSMVGLMLKYSQEEILRIMEKRIEFHPFVVPGKGLTLVKVNYS